jgi:DMSO/TMAO reductase YedYZ heme-binding membrane subunit
MAWKIVKNIMCLIVLSALLVAVGAIFYGCRMFLLSIFEPLAGLQASFFSVPHLIAYLLFFLIIDVFRYLGTDRVINMLVLLQNPASDEDSR